MNILKTHTLHTSQPDTYKVYWSNSAIRLGGLFIVRIAANVEDRHIAAELAAIQHLLEEKAILGRNLSANAGIRLIVSLGAIRKLQRRQSNKAHLAPYASFLTTRFAGCQIEVDKDARWFEGIEPESIEYLLVMGPRRETLHVTGIGEVSVTRHVLDQFALRFLPEAIPGKTARIAWKKLVSLAAEPSVREVSRDSVWVRIRYRHHGKQEGRYFLNAKRNLVLVVTDNPNEGKRLVTTYRATRHFHDLPMAA
jgi:hypothetical protein